MKHKLTPEQFNEHLEDLMDQFDFARVHETMVALDWGWNSAGGEVPTEPHIRANARKLLKNAYESESGFCSTGGFDAEIFGDFISLKFIVTDWETS